MSAKNTRGSITEGGAAGTGAPPAGKEQGPGGLDRDRDADAEGERMPHHGRGGAADHRLPRRGTGSDGEVAKGNTPGGGRLSPPGRHGGGGPSRGSARFV